MPSCIDKKMNLQDLPSKKEVALCGMHLETERGRLNVLANLA